MTTASTAPTRPARIARATSLRDAFGPLEVRNYRLYVLSQVLMNTAGWAARVAQNWLILQLTGSTALVGLTVAFQFAPSVAFGLHGGVVADRYSRRTILVVTQLCFGLSTLAVGLLALTGYVQPWHVLLAAALTGVTIAYDNPARQAFVYEIAGPEHMRQAISINSAVFQLGALVGPAVAGVLISAVGEGWAFVLNAAACFTAMALVVAMRTSELSPTEAVVRAKGQLREGLAHSRREPAILWPTVLVGAVALTGINMNTVLAAYTDDVFKNGAGGYALLTSMLAVGGVVGSLISARSARTRLRHLATFAAVIGVLLLVLAATSSQALFLVVLVVLGTVSLVYLTGSNSLVQQVVPDDLRGRVMALYLLVLLGGQAASGVIIGWVSEHGGAHVAMAVSASGPLLGALAVAWAIAHGQGMHPRDVVAQLPRRTVWRAVEPDRAPGGADSPADPTYDAPAPCDGVPAPRRSGAVSTHP